MKYKVQLDGAFWEGILIDVDQCASSLQQHLQLDSNRE